MIRAVFNYGLGGYLPQVIAFFITPLLTHYVSEREQGIIEICNYTQLLLVMVMRLGMPGSLVRYYFEFKDGPEFRDLVTTTAVSILVFSIGLGAVCMVVLPPVFRHASPDIPFYPWMTISIVTAVFQAAPDLQRRLHAAREQSAASAKLSVANAVILLTSTVICVIPLGQGAWGTQTAQLFSAIVFFLVCLVNNRHDLAGRFSWDTLRLALRFGVPLVPHHASAWAQQFVGRLLLGALSSLSQVGWLSIAGKVASPLTIAIGAFTTAYQPIYFAWRSDLSAEAALLEIRSVARAVLALGAVAVIGAATLGGVLIRQYMAPEYAPAAGLVGLSGLALLLQLTYNVVGQELFFIKGTGRASRIFIGASAINILLCLPLIGPMGALGALAAQLVGGVVACWTTWLICRASFPSPVSFRLVTSTLGSAAAACVAAVAWVPAGRLAQIGVALVIFIIASAVCLVASGADVQLRGDLARLMGARRIRGKKAVVSGSS
jgi:O-antigen/teichoic acid export membrane protein